MPANAASRSGSGGAAGVTASDAAHLQHATWAFTTRRVRMGTFGFLREGVTPQPGDLVLARVDVIGHHTNLQLPDGRRKTLFTGDEIVVAYGNRYAPNQFEAVVPKTLGPCQLVAAGGIAGKALSWHTRVSRGPTQITPLGLLAGPSGAPANLGDYALPPIAQVPAPRPTVVAVAGTAMDSGKTQTAAYLVKGLSLAGLHVAYAKVTGTGSCGDTWFLKDAGARPVLDFTDAGLVSTYLVPPEEVERVFVTLVAHLARSGADAIVLEIADGVLQAETAALLVSPSFRAIVSGILFAANDAMGAVAGESWLRSRGLPLVGLGGVLTAAPLQREECVKTTGLPVYSRSDLACPRTAVEVLTLCGSARPAEAPGPANRRPVRSSAAPEIPWTPVLVPSGDGVTGEVEVLP